MVGKTKRGKGTKIMAVVDGNGLPVGVRIESASPHEVTLLEPTLDSVVTEGDRERIIGDKAYDSDALDARLEAERGIQLITPNRSNRFKSPGRPALAKVSATLESRAPVRLASELPTPRHPLGPWVTSNIRSIIS
jgi:hypothetical protein